MRSWKAPLPWSRCEYVRVCARSRKAPLPSLPFWWEWSHVCERPRLWCACVRSLLDVSQVCADVCGCVDIPILSCACTRCCVCMHRVCVHACICVLHCNCMWMWDGVHGCVYRVCRHATLLAPCISMCMCACVHACAYLSCLYTKICAQNQGCACTCIQQHRGVTARYAATRMHAHMRKNTHHFRRSRQQQQRPAVGGCVADTGNAMNGPWPRHRQ